MIHDIMARNHTLAYRLMWNLLDVGKEKWPSIIKAPFGEVCEFVNEVSEGLLLFDPVVKIATQNTNEVKGD